MLCEFGCGKEAKFIYSGKHCCSTSFFGCPGWIKTMMKDVGKMSEQEENKEKTEEK